MTTTTTTTTVEDLEKRVAALEAGRQYQADRAAVQAVEHEHLVQLRTIRNSLVGIPAASSGDAATTSLSSAASLREIAILRDENERLRHTVAKLRYRVDHLVDGMEGMIQRHQHQNTAAAAVTGAAKPASA